MWQVTIGSGVLFVALMAVLAIALVVVAFLPALNHWQDRNNRYHPPHFKWVPISLGLVALSIIPIFCIVERGQRVTLLSGDWWAPLALLGGLALVLWMGRRVTASSDRSLEDLSRRKASQARFFSWVAGLALLWAFGSWVSPKREAPLNYQQRICEGAFEKETQINATHFTVTLQEGCWGGWVNLPAWSPRWSYQAEGDVAGWWVAFWFEKAPHPEGVFRANDKPEFTSHPYTFRLQGKGKITFYINARNSGKNTGELSTTPQHEDSSPPGTAQQRNGYVFTMGSCTMAADAVSCTVSVENKKEQRNFLVNSSTRIVAGGRAQKVKRMTFGSTRMVDCCWVETIMPPDVPFELSVEFEGVSKEAKTCLLELIGGSVVQGNFDVTFCGVPITK